MRFSGFSVKGPGKSRLYFSNGSGKNKSSSSGGSGTPAGTKWRIGVGIFFLLGFIGGLISDEKDVALLIFCLLFGLALVFWPFVVWGFGTLFDKLKKGKPVAEPEPHAETPATEAESVPAAEFRPDAKVSAYSTYDYDDVGLYRPEGVCAAMPQLGDVLHFAFQPDNTYDAEAVYAANAAGENVGYLNKGKLRDFVTDALDNYWPCIATVTRAEEQHLEVSIEIEKNE